MLASFGEEASDDPAFRGVRRRRRMNQKSALFFRVVYSTFGSFSFQSNDSTTTNGKRTKKTLEISRDRGRTSALRKEERENAERWCRRPTPIDFRGGVFFSLLSGVVRYTKHNTNTHQQKRERDKTFCVCVKKAPKKASKKRPKKASRKDAFYY